MNDLQIIHHGTVADTIRRLRISENLSQRDLASLAKVHKDDIDKIEHEIPVQVDIKLKILRV